AFQGADVKGVTTPITKYSYQVSDIKDLPRIVREAFHIATTGRPGAVVVDIPKNIAKEGVTDTFDTDFYHTRNEPTVNPNPLQIKRVMNALKTAKKPVILAGAGVQFAQGSEELREFAEKHKIPVTTTLLGLGTFPGTHEQSIGMAGMHGSYAAN